MLEQLLASSTSLPGLQSSTARFMPTLQRLQTGVLGLKEPSFSLKCIFRTEAAPLGVTYPCHCHPANHRPHSTVPTQDQILVPETLLKKRKSQEKERESRAQELQKRREVGLDFHLSLYTGLQRLGLW